MTFNRRRLLLPVNTLIAVAVLLVLQYCRAVTYLSDEHLHKLSLGDSQQMDALAKLPYVQRPHDRCSSAECIAASFRFNYTDACLGHSPSAGGTLSDSNGAPLRMVWSINTGRTGSGYLAQIFTEISSVASYHEPKPQHWGWLSMITRANQGYRRTFGQRYMKAIAVERTIEIAADNQTLTYLESSHAFVELHWDVLMCHFRDTSKYNIVIMHLYRPIEETVHSLLRVEFRRSYYYSYDSREVLATPWLRNLPQLLDREVDRIDEAIAYVIDIESQVQLFKRRFPHIPVVSASLAQMSSLPEFLRVCQELGIHVSEADEVRLRNRLGVPVNTKSSKEFTKKATGGEYDAELLKIHRRVIEIIKVFENAGYPLPSITMR